MDKRSSEWAEVETGNVVHIDGHAFNVWVGITQYGGICTRVYNQDTGDLLYECWNDVRSDGSTSGKNCIENNC